MTPCLLSLLSLTAILAVSTAAPYTNGDSQRDLSDINNVAKLTKFFRQYLNEEVCV